MTEPIISVDNIHKSYLMGPSGSGKTTLLNIVGRLDEPSRGHVIVDDENLVALSENELARLRLQKMDFVFQNYILSGMTGRAEIRSEE